MLDIFGDLFFVVFRVSWPKSKMDYKQDDVDLSPVISVSLQYEEASFVHFVVFVREVRRCLQSHGPPVVL
jgi:hypothetical protein